jgi:ribosomal protein L11 methyltransferase
MAFGTGEHESTKMCLALLEKLGVLGKTVSDIGCGSGILGIASLKLGASSCYFSDIDPEALNNMRENATLNGVLDKSTIVQASLLSGAPIGRDIILANLTADILIRLTAELPLYIDGNTQIIVSGIILERENDVLTAFAKIGLEQKERLTLNDWAAFRF